MTQTGLYILWKKGLGYPFNYQLSELTIEPSYIFVDFLSVLSVHNVQVK